MDAFRLPKKTNSEITCRNNSIQEATKYAIEIPLKTLELICEVLKNADYVINNGNINSFSDSGVSAEIAIASAKSAIMNIKINLKEIEDDLYKKQILSKIKKINSKIDNKAILIRKKIDKIL